MLGLCGVLSIGRRSLLPCWSRVILVIASATTGTVTNHMLVSLQLNTQKRSFCVIGFRV